MSLQNKTLHRYRTVFPQDTLREVSGRTGIQITRVFRLFNGKTMKVGELEAFEKVISDKLAESPYYQQINDMLEEMNSLLTLEEMAKITAYIERKVVTKKYSRTYIRPYTTAIIA